MIKIIQYSKSILMSVTDIGGSLIWQIIIMFKLNNIEGFIK